MFCVIASNNKKKVEELKRILTPLDIIAKTPAELGVTLDEVEETGSTFRDNAELKAVAAMKKTGFAAIADDSGLCVDALGGRPGVFSARYAETDEEEQRGGLVLALGQCAGEEYLGIGEFGGTLHTFDIGELRRADRFPEGRNEPPRTRAEKAQ